MKAALLVASALALWSLVALRRRGAPTPGVAALLRLRRRGRAG